MDVEKNDDPEMNPEAEPIIEGEEALRDALTAERERANANLAGWQRAQADFANYKRRADQERQDASRFANQCLIMELLPVLDDLERALAAVPEELADHNWTDGIRLIGRKLWANLQSQGVTQIAAVGEPFDPHFHEAVMQCPGEEGIVVEEVQKGYRLHDRVVRPSKVVVGSGEIENNQQGGEV